MAATARAHWHGPRRWPLDTEDLYYNQLALLTEPMFGIEQPMADAHSNDTELFLVLDSGPNSACPGPRFDVRSK